MKKHIIALVAVASLLALSAVAFAGPRGGKGASQPALTAEQRATIQKVIEDHQEKLYELREKIWAKHAELQALSNSGKAERSDIQSLVADIAKLRDAMHKERLAINADIEKKTGLKGYGYGHGYHGGYHRGGMGGGMGYGCGDDCGPGYGGKGYGRGGY